MQAPEAVLGNQLSIQGLWEVALWCQEVGVTLEGSDWVVSITPWADTELTLAALGYAGTVPGAQHKESRLARLYPRNTEGSGTC